MDNLAPVSSFCVSAFTCTIVEFCILCAIQLQTLIAIFLLRRIISSHILIDGFLTRQSPLWRLPPLIVDLLTTANPSCRNEANGFLELCLRFNLFRAFDQPTRDTNILYLLLTNSPDNLRNILYLPGISDYKPINLTLWLPVEANETVRKTIKNYSKANIEAVNWELQVFLSVYKITFLSHSTNENSSLFKNKLQDLTNRYIGSLAIKSNKHQPW